MSYELRSTFATLPRTSRGQAIVLGGDPKGKNFLYVNGNSVIIRDIENPAIADIYTEHSCQTTVAKYSPSGFYICSGDVSGKVRIWDTVNKEHILKNEFPIFNGPIKDLAWSPDQTGNKIVVVGEGKEIFGKVFNAETGTSVGEIMGQSKLINSVDYRPTRPFRICTASDDNTVAFFHGPPFKFQFTSQDHSRFVNTIRYSPDGEAFASGGADGKIFIYDGKSGEKRGEIGSPAHKGGVYGLTFSPDNQFLLSVSGDKTAKLFDVNTCALVNEFVMGNTVEDMQVACLWQGPHMLTVSLSGFINYLDKNNPNSPLRIIKGHNKPITALSVSEDGSHLYSGCAAGRICEWSVPGGQNDLFAGKGHANQVQDMTLDEDTITSVGIDDVAIVSSASNRQYSAISKMPSQPRAISAGKSGLSVVACINEVVLMRNGRPVFTEKVGYEASAVAIHPGQHQVAIGSNKENKIRIYAINGDTLQEQKTLDVSGYAAVTDLAFSPNAEFLAASDTNKRISLYSLPNYETLISTEWTYHTARVNCVDWNKENKLVSGGLDTSAIIWTPEKKSALMTIKKAHAQAAVNKVRWLDNNTIVTVAQDSNIKIWSIKL